MNFANSTVSQKQSNAERLMRCIIQFSLTSDDSIVRCQECFLYTYTGVGLSALSRFDLSGNARAFIAWNERQNRLRAFSYVFKTLISQITQSGAAVLMEMA